MLEIQNSKFKIQNYNSKFKVIKKLLTFALLTLIFNFALLTFNLGKVSAQASRSITVVPPAVQLPLNPGDKSEGILKVINDSDETLTFNVAIRDFIIVDNNGTPNFLPQNTFDQRHSAAAWVGVYPNNFMIAPHTKKTLNYYIQVPPDARPGGHYAGIVYEPATTADLKGSGTAVQTKIGTLVYITINGDINEQANVTKFLANLFQEYGPVAVNTQINNLGDLHIAPFGKIEIKDLLGRVVETQELNKNKNNIYPGSKRDFDNLFGENKPMIGRYTINMLASYGKNNNLPLTAAISFWIFPWKIATIVILAAIAVILAIKFIKKSGKEKIDTDSKRINAEKSK